MTKSLDQILSNIENAASINGHTGKGIYATAMSTNWDEFYYNQKKINLRRYIACLVRTECINTLCEFSGWEKKRVHIPDDLYELGFRCRVSNPRSIVLKCLEILGYSIVSIGIDWNNSTNGFIPIVKFYKYKNEKEHFVGNRYSVKLEPIVYETLFGNALVAFAGTAIEPIYIEALPY